MIINSAPFILDSPLVLLLFLWVFPLYCLQVSKKKGKKEEEEEEEKKL
jgi:hypothetical protein